VTHNFTGLQVAQVRLIFALPANLQIATKPKYLAYLEWFTPFHAPNPDSKLYSVTRSTLHQGPRAEVVPLTQIASSCHLIPRYGTFAPTHWTAENVLETCKTFFLGRSIDLRTFYLLQ
jgi:hypothetical protein